MNFLQRRPVYYVWFELYLMRLGSQQFFNSISRYGVEKNQNNHRQRNNDEQFQNGPFVIMPQNVSDGLDGIHEPHKR